MSDRRELKAGGEISEDELRRLVPIAKPPPKPKDRSVVQPTFITWPLQVTISFRSTGKSAVNSLVGSI